MNPAEAENSGTLVRNSVSGWKGNTAGNEEYSATINIRYHPAELPDRVPE